MMIQLAATPGTLFRPWRASSQAAPALFHSHDSDRRRKFRREVARRWDLLQLEEERKPTGRRV
ncbi:MAG: hypothetical protein RL549_1477 [Verrucomicrobiota bacterium]|jgi:hypothetical protein